VGFIKVAPVDNHEAMVAPSSALGWQLALEGYKPKQSWGAFGSTPFGSRFVPWRSMWGGSRRQMTKHEWSEPDWR